MTSNERQQQIGAAYIPSHIMCDSNLTITQKVLWGRIQGLSTKSGYCYASNEWIGNQLGLKKGTVSNIISQLVDGGYLMRRLIRNEAGEITERWLYPICKQFGGVSTQELIGVSTQELPGIHTEVEGGIHAGVEGSVRGSSSKEESKGPSSDKPKISKDDLTTLTEHYAHIRGARPRGKAWLPIQQGFRQMVVEEGYTIKQVTGCMDRLVEWGVTWTINTTRRWIADYAAGKMPSKDGSVDTTYNATPSPEAVEIWKKVETALKAELSSSAFESWFDKVVPIASENGTFTLAVADAYTRGGIERRFRKRIEELLGMKLVVRT